MTRTNAREIALGCIFEYLATDHDINEIIFSRKEYLAAGDLSEESNAYSTVMDESSENYLILTTSLAVEHQIELFAIIEEYSATWKLDRISLMSKSILLLALTEILYIDNTDVPISVAVNEAVNLAKKYDIDKAPAYINGLLGKYIRETELKNE